MPALSSDGEINVPCGGSGYSPSGRFPPRTFPWLPLPERKMLASDISLGLGLISGLGLRTWLAASFFMF